MAKARPILNLHGTTVDIIGEEVLGQRLDELGQKLGEKILKKAVSKGLTEQTKAMRKAAPNKSAKKSIGKKTRISRTQGVLQAVAGVNVNKKGKKRFPHITIPLTSKEKTRRRALIGGRFQWVERMAAQFGTVKGMRRRRRTGRLKRDEWVRRAYAASEARTRGVIAKELWRQIKVNL